MSSARFIGWGIVVVVAAAGATAPALGHPNGEPMGLGDPGGAEPGAWEASGILVRGHVALGDFPGVNTTANDCWGYVSPSGREYGLIGLRRGIGFVEVTDPANPAVVEFIPGPDSLWHDVKVIGHYAYAVSEGGMGIQVIDMSQIDAGIVTDVGQTGDQSTHNIAANPESGFLYRCGGGSNIGLHVYDANQTPEAPVLVGAWNDYYVHDAQVVTWHGGPFDGREIAFCCSGTGYGGGSTALRIVDVTDKSNMVLLSTTAWSASAFSHQGWLSEDRRYFYLNDELDERTHGLTTTTRVFDVADLTAPTLAGSFTNGNRAIDHNLYTRGNLIFEANYRSGLRVFDATNPTNPVEVAYVDTYPADDAREFDGAWSVYPYLPSGTILVSDIQQGLIVAQVQLERLEIDVVGVAPSSLPTGGGHLVQVRVEEVNRTLDPGSVTLHVDDGRAVRDIPAVQVEPAVFEAVTPPLPCGVEVQYWFSAAATDGSVYYEPAVWPQHALTALTADEIAVARDDDFESDAGWTVVNDATLTSGAWERGVPAGDGQAGDPLSDYDGSGACWLTGNAPGNTDVDGGETFLISPAFDAAGPESAAVYVEYAVSYSNSLGNAPNADLFVIELSPDDGTTWTVLDVLGPTASSGWRHYRHRIDQLVPPTSTMRVQFAASDFDAGSLVEAAVDAVRVEVLSCTPCPADLTGQDPPAVDVFDLLAYLDLWFEADAAAEWTNDAPAMIDVFDLLAYLNEWFEGC